MKKWNCQTFLWETIAYKTYWKSVANSTSKLNFYNGLIINNFTRIIYNGNCVYQILVSYQYLWYSPGLKGVDGVLQGFSDLHIDFLSDHPVKIDWTAQEVQVPLLKQSLETVVHQKVHPFLHLAHYLLVSQLFLRVKSRGENIQIRFGAYVCLYSRFRYGM